MTVLAITITTPSPAFDKQSAEVTWLGEVMLTIMKEIGRGRGTVQSGTILGTNPMTGAANTSLGTWTYTPSAAKP